MSAIALAAEWIGPPTRESARELTLAGWYHVVTFGVILPLLALRSRGALAGSSTGQRDGEPPVFPDRLQHFKRTSVVLILLALVSVLVANVEWIELFPPSWPTPISIAAGVVLYSVLVVAMRPRWRRAVERGAPVVHLSMPRNSKERVWWIVVSVLAGVGEEISWRGVQTTLLTLVIGDFWIAAFLSAASFGIAHFIQGWKSVGIIVLLALGFQTLVWLSGSLYVAMAVHVAYDITAGLSYGQLGKRLGCGPVLRSSGRGMPDPDTTAKSK
jgi:membrane protease YdiL (CAAX protease family)